jgi:four helix bundle protein
MMNDYLVAESVVSDFEKGYQVGVPVTRNTMQTRTLRYAHDCVDLGLQFQKTKLGYHLQNQLIRSSTSVAANYRAANLAHSTAAFAAKLSIVIEEADESTFWLEFALDKGVIQSETTNKLIKEGQELTAIFVASRKTIQNNLLKNK